MISKGQVVTQLANEDDVSLKALVDKTEGLQRMRVAQFKAFHDIRKDLLNKMGTSKIHIQHANESAQVLRRIGAIVELIMSKGKFYGREAKKAQYFDIQGIRNQNINNSQRVSFVDDLDRSNYA